MSKEECKLTYNILLHSKWRGRLQSRTFHRGTKGGNKGICGSNLLGHEGRSNFTLQKIVPFKEKRLPGVQTLDWRKWSQKLSLVQKYRILAVLNIVNYHQPNDTTLNPRECYHGYTKRTNDKNVSLSSCKSNQNRHWVQRGCRQRGSFCWCPVKELALASDT